MTGSSKGKDADRNEDRHLSPIQTKILYHLYRRKKFVGSIVEFSKDMGYSSDGSINPNLRYLIRKGYAREEEGTKTFTLTRDGRDKIGFIILPDYLLLAILVVGIGNLLSAYYYFALGIPPWPYSGLIGGIAMLVLVIVITVVKRRMVKEFLALREPLTVSESLPATDAEDGSVQ